MKKIDSDALGVLNKSLGLTGAGSPITELTDGVVDQIIAVNEIARRGRTQAGSEGIYIGVMRCINTNAETNTVQVNPYNVGTGVIAPYPDPMPPQFDVWLLAATVRRQSGGGTIEAELSLQYASSQQGWGVDDAGVAVVVSDPTALAFWSSINTVHTAFAVLQGSNGPWWRGGIRIPRNVDAALRFSAESSLTSTWNCSLVLGVFPTSLGQDGLV